jgi:hypothetical protein
MSKTLKGKFRPKNPEKYKGNAGRIEYRSSWELNYMNWLDRSDKVLQWMSEERAIWYLDPVTKKKRRYFPDFIVKYERSDGIIVEEVVEIKPYKQVIGPPTNPKRRTKSWHNSVMTYVTNKAKWKAATEWAEDRGMNFRLLTEKDVPGWSGSVLGH